MVVPEIDRILTVDIEETTAQQKDDGENSREPLRSYYGTVWPVKQDAVLRQISHDDATACCCCLPTYA